ncbi:histidine phosphatase family protein [Colwellia psychrerythraea]|uniref:Phosphoglycerate mutase n=1 Tax=Colwellia psychrerythraea TaxID=28229 RepID=A0A099L068_COLPS|nr:histidine phosphatase family protein [Colwellia psychrerythraea]KGJ96251.1 Phosphoglycerate mutase [Colwellia psychrerythraea]
MIEIDLIRHVKVAGKPALYGRTDVQPIVTENVHLLERLVAQQKTSKAYQCIISSPLIRCQHLAKEFSHHCEIPLEISLGLQEMNFGCFDGVPFDDIPFGDEPSIATGISDINDQRIELHWSQLEAFFQAPAEIMLPNAEALADFHHRVIKTWQELIAQHIVISSDKKALKIPQRILVIAHGGVIRMILAHILQLDWQQASWHQKLQIGHGSLTRINISQPYQDINSSQQQTLPDQYSRQAAQQLHQQVMCIAMPLLEGF